jgi:hypothetical protein
MPLHILFQILLILISQLSKAQTKNSSNGYICIKANVASFKDNDYKRFSHGNPNYDAAEKGYFSHGVGTEKIYSQINNKPFISFGSELDYFFNRYNFFGFNIGIAYSYDKTFYNFKSSPNLDSRYYYLYPSFRELGNGDGSFTNHMFKFVWGLNFNFKFGLTLFIQPLNPEFRSIVEKNDDFTFTTYQYFKYKAGKNAGYDSASVYVSEVKREEDFVNYKTRFNYNSIAFPTSVGLEQKFKIGKLKYVAGASATISLLEQYVVYRAHIGICFGNFKDKSQPGY